MPRQPPLHLGMFVGTSKVFQSVGVSLLRYDIRYAGRTDLHRDFIHVNAAGQRAYATLFACIAEAAGRAALPEDCGAVAGASAL